MPVVNEVALEPQKQLETRALTLPEQARAIRIADQQTLEIACGLTLAAKALRKEIVAYHKPLKQAADRAKQAILDAENRMLAGPLEAERILDPAIAVWQTEQRRLDEEARRAEALRAQQEADRQRALAAVEAQKAQKRAEEEALKLAMQAEKAGASTENVTAILEQATVMSQAEVAAILRDPVVVMPRPVTPTYEKVKGISVRDNWRFEITDESAIPREYLMPDMTKIGGVVRAMKDRTNISGIRVYNEPTAVGRTA